MSAKTANVEGTDSEDSIVDYFVKNPRMIGVLFTMLLLLTQAGNVAAGNQGGIMGP